MQHPQSDDSAWQVHIVRHREVTGVRAGIVAGQLRFMHQRRASHTRAVRSAPAESTITAQHAVSIRPATVDATVFRMSREMPRPSIVGNSWTTKRRLYLWSSQGPLYLNSATHVETGLLHPIKTSLRPDDGVDSHARRSGDESTDSGSGPEGQDSDRACPGIEACGSRRQGRSLQRA
jgi:hypothetical protein